MGLSNNTTTQRTIVRPAGLKKEENDPHLTKVVKEGDNYVNEGRFSKVSGLFGGIDFKTYGEGKESRRAFSISIIDMNDGLFEFQCGFNAIGRGILNCLASQPSLGDIEISLYKNKNGWPASYITNNGKRCEWLLSIDEQNELVIPIVNPKTGETIQNDHSDLDTKLEEAMSKFKDNSAMKIDTPVVEEQDDLPFR